MSNYRNFVSDFPKRCDDLLRHFFNEANVRDLDVTLMLTVATAGFVVPFERLSACREARPQTCPHCEKELPTRPPVMHPARDRARYAAAAQEFDELLKRPFSGSSLGKESAPDEWFFAREVEAEGQDPDGWPDLRNPKPVSREKSAGSILKHVRNALAHGNVFTRGSPINLIVLLSKADGASKYAMLAVTPAAFRHFLHNWFKFLRELPMPDGVLEDYRAA